MELITTTYITDSFKGIKKEENQDNVLITSAPGYDLFVVFDGLGSAVNSREATEVAASFIHQNHLHYVKNGVLQLQKLMHNANLHLIKREIPDALTTYCAVCIPEETPRKFMVSSLGDSRVYLLSTFHGEQVTKDDRLFPHKNVITRCLGMKELKKKDFTQKEIYSEYDFTLLCTDGFYYFMEEMPQEFFDVFKAEDLSLMKILLEKLISGKNEDDATYIVIRNRG